MAMFFSLNLPDVKFYWFENRNISNGSYPCLGCLLALRYQNEDGSHVRSLYVLGFCWARAPLTPKFMSRKQLTVGGPY